MARVQTRGEVIRSYLVENISKYPNDIARKAAAHFGITRQAINKHLQRLIGAGAISLNGKTRGSAYELRPLSNWEKAYALTSKLTEDQVWREDVAPVLGEMPENGKDIWQYGFTAMFNNAIDHSGAGFVSVRVAKTAAAAEVVVMDDGIGIFKKLKTRLG